MPPEPPPGGPPQDPRRAERVADPEPSGGPVPRPPPEEPGGPEQQARPANGAPSGAVSDSSGQGTGASLGQATRTNYRKTFFKENPDLKGKVRVHHAVEKRVLEDYPGLFTWQEIHSLENLRGIPNAVNPKLHLSKIRVLWNKFYLENPNPTKKMFLEMARKIDNQLGDQFTPPTGSRQ
jgi:hypothetical protein